MEEVQKEIANSDHSKIARFSNADSAKEDNGNLWYDRTTLCGSVTKRVSMGWWHLRLSAKILALLRLSANFFQFRLTKKLKINFFVSKS